MKMRCGAGPLAVLAAVFWTQCILLDGVEARKERKRPKEAAPQHTEAYNVTLSNSEEVVGGIKVGIGACDRLLFNFPLFVKLHLQNSVYSRHTGC